MKHAKTLGLVVVIALAALTAGFKPFANLAPEGHYILAVILVTLGLWIFRDPSLPYLAGGAILLGGSLACGLPLNVVATGYISSAVWVLIPALFFGFALVKTGLGKRIAYFVLKTFEPSYFNVMLLYDISRSVHFGRKELLQAHIAVSLAYSAILSNDGCGLILFADDIVEYIPPRMGRSHFMEILNAIARAEPVACGATKLGVALTELINEVPESLTFILSDFMYPLDFSYSFHHTAHGTNKHEVKAIQVLEEFEIELPAHAKGIVPLYDYESGTTATLDLSKWKKYNDTMSRMRENTRNRLNRAGIDLVTISPADDFTEKINTFMKRPPSRW